MARVRDRVGFIGAMLLALVVTHACSPTYAVAGEPSRYNARATLERAKVGTYAPRAGLPVRVEVVRPTRLSLGVERMTCQPDTLRPERLTCTYRTP